MNRYRVASLVAVLSLVAFLGPATTSLAFAAGGAIPNAVVTATPTAAGPVDTVTFIAMLCPSYTVVPANRTPTVSDATGGHAAQLDTSYQTSVVSPATDLPKACTPADGWSFQMYGAYPPGGAPTVGAPVVTGGDGAGTGSTTITLTSAEVTLAQSTGSPTGLWVVELTNPSIAGFGALRCYHDIHNGDDRENIRGIGTTSQHAYCIGYNVAVAQATPTPTAVSSATPTAVSSATPTAVSSATPTPFQSFEGVTSQPRPSTTPPPTSTGSTDGSGSNTTPMLALLISVAFGAMGLFAVESQRRTRVGRR
jgi:hypothetical protein